MQLLGWFMAIMGFWSTFSWIGILLSEQKSAFYIQSMNRIGTVFTERTFAAYVLGIIIILICSFVSGMLILRKKLMGKKIAVFILHAYPAYNFCWLLINATLGYSIKLFALNTVAAGAFCYLLTICFNSPGANKYFHK